MLAWGLLLLFFTWPERRPLQTKLMLRCLQQLLELSADAVVVVNRQCCLLHCLPSGRQGMLLLCSLPSGKEEPAKSASPVLDHPVDGSSSLPRVAPRHPQGPQEGPGGED